MSVSVTCPLTDEQLDVVSGPKYRGFNRLRATTIAVAATVEERQRLRTAIAQHSNQSAVAMFNAVVAFVDATARKGGPDA